jgi:predicted PurR-regulated permease PerM
MTLINAFALMGIVTLALFLLIVGANLLIPIVIAIVFWFLINVIADAIQKVIPKGRWISVGLAIIILGLLAWVPFQLATNAFPQVMEMAPKYQKNIEDLSRRFFSSFNLTEGQVIEQLRNWINIPMITSLIASTIASLTGQFVLILLYVAFLLVDQSMFPYKLEVMFINSRTRSRVEKMLTSINQKAKTYLWVKTFLSFITGITSYIILAIVGVDFAAFWAVLIFLLNFIPTLGSIIGVIFPALLALVQFETIYPFIIVLAGCGTLQFVIGNVLEPKLMGSSLNLSTFVILLSLTVWFTIWGAIGAFLSVPITVIMMIIFSEFESTRGAAVVLSGDGKIVD